MKAARKVGDAKKHECTFARRSSKSPSDLPHSKARVHGLIETSPFVMLCVCSHSQNRFHVLSTAVPENLFKKFVRIISQVGDSEEKTSMSTKRVSRSESWV